jgi:Undecaprenyl-phosphate glucose phosphotransferase
MSEASLGVDLKSERWQRPISPTEIIYAIRVYEFLVIVITGLIAFEIISPRVSASLVSTYISTSALGAVLGAIMLRWVGSYEIDVWHRRREALKRMLSGACLTAFALLGIGFVFKVAVIDISRLWSVTWFMSACAALLVGRVVAFNKMGRLRVEGRFDVRVVIYGAGSLGMELLRFIGESRPPMMRVVGFADDRTARVSGAAGKVPIIGGLPELERLIRQGAVDEVIIALPWTAAERIHQIVGRLALTPVPVRLAPDLVGFRFVHRGFRELNGLPLLEVAKRPMSSNAWINKCILDRAAAAIAMLIFAPAILLTALAIKLDSPGPVLFRQNRVGFNNRTIRVWKFRTMRHDLAENDNIRQAQRQDPRVTRVGKFLRRTSLDELPQLWNVLTGEMSLVGPRPHAPSTKAAGRPFDQVVEYYAARHKVKPGITGWAQVNGWRGETDTEEKLIKRVEHDLYYINNWSMGFDLYILARTFVALLNLQNTY